MPEDVLPIDYIESDAALRDMCATARAEGRFGIDLEFIRDRTYFAKLALIQVNVDDICVLIDPLSSLDLSPLEELMSDEETIKVVHAGSQDLEIFFHRTRQVPHQIFDTQIAAAMLGMGTQISLGNLVERVLGIRLAKGESFTDWLQRPLTRRQETYAIHDVRHLLELHDRLSERLEELGRMEWMREEHGHFERSETYLPDPRQMYRSVKRSGTLDSRGLAVLRELAAWRELEARRRDRPRRSVVSDEALVEIARTAPKQSHALKRTRGLHPQECERSGMKILKAIRIGKELPKDKCPKESQRRIPRRDADLVADLAGTFLKVRCAELEIDSSFFATSSELMQLVSDHMDGNLDPERYAVLGGWRGELLGEDLLAFLRGEIALRIDDNFQPRLDRH